MRLKIQKHKQWIILLIVFLICCLIGGIFLIVMFTPSHHDYSSTEQTTQTEQAEDEKSGTYYVYGGAHGLPLCSASSSYAKIITVIPDHAEVKIISSEIRGYYKIQYDNKEGYVKSSYLLEYGQDVSDQTKQKLINDYPLYYVIASEDTVKMYKTKKESSKVLAEIPVGYRVRILGQAQDGYYRVAYRNKVGYITSDNLTQYEQ